MIHFANPLGLWALLALPVIVLIHCLQERSRRLRVSTLFLLERVAPESVSGARFERLRNSPSLWLQLLAAALIAWLLAEPRWMREDSAQTVVIVLDSSASMSAYKQEARKALERVLHRWARHAASTQWQIIETDPRKATLYSGTELDQALASLERWQPAKGTHAMDGALLIARGLVKAGDGLVIYVSDHKAEVPSDVALLAVGAPKDNAGFSGLEVKLEGGRMTWRALLTNHGRGQAVRSWWIEHKLNAQPRKTELRIDPGQSLAIQGELPAEVDQATLCLDADEFAFDDRLPMQRPLEQDLHVMSSAKGESAQRLIKMLVAAPHVAIGANKAELMIAEIGTDPSTDAVLIDTAAAEGEQLDATPVVAENHPLTSELNWSGLLTPKPRALAVLETDAPLLWKGETVLALLRRTATAEGKAVQQLILNWDLAKSNAHRLPALVVMLQRYAEDLRSKLAGERAGNFEFDESINLADNAGAQLIMGNRTEPFQLRAPESAGFFEVKKGDQRLLRGACHFADAREANLRECSSIDTSEALRSEAALRATEADPLKALWILAVLICLAGAWFTQCRESRPFQPLVVRSAAPT